MIFNKNHNLDTTTVGGARLALSGHVDGRGHLALRVGTKAGGVAFDWGYVGSWMVAMFGVTRGHKRMVAVDWHYVGMWMVAAFGVTRGHKNGAHPTSRVTPNSTTTPTHATTVGWAPPLCPRVTPNSTTTHNETRRVTSNYTIIPTPTKTVCGTRLALQGRVIGRGRSTSRVGTKGLSRLIGIMSTSGWSQRSTSRVGTKSVPTLRTPHTTQELAA